MFAEQPDTVVKTGNDSHVTVKSDSWRRNGLAWTPLQGLSRAERLDGFYGSIVRRISHDSALLEAGMPMKAGLSVSADMDDKGTAADYFIWHHREDSETLRISARQIDSRTWLSSPERALLEYAQDCPNLAAEETLMLVFYAGVLSEMQDFWKSLLCLSLQMGFHDGIRRIASAGSQFSKHDMPNGNDTEFLNSVSSAAKADRWIEISPQREQAGCRPVVFKDRKHKVLWRVHPEAVLDVLEH